VECFLEGPCFDRDGNLWVLDIAFGRIFRIDPNGMWDLVIQYDGWPNGMKIRQDERLFIGDLYFTDRGQPGVSTRRTLHIVQAMTAEILVARLPVAGKELYRHRQLSLEGR
jgi:sugar lactone lactonase YvrE